MESINDALIDCVKALGGSKAVGALLWPEKPADAAQRMMLDCLNPERPNRLNPEQVVLLLRKARQAGWHNAAEWLMGDLGYAKPVPVEPQDEMARLQREFIAATQGLQAVAAQIQQLQNQVDAGRPTLRAAA